MSMEVRNQTHFDAVCAFADEVGLREQLDAKLKWLDEYRDSKSRCVLTPDFAPHSFGFVLQVPGADGDYRTLFVGGLIFHGPHDGGGDGSFPTLAVSVEPTHGWQIHP